MAETITSTTTAPARRPGFGELLANRDFRFFWGAYAATGTADFFTYVALAWVTLDLTRSAAWVAAVLAVQTVARVGVLLFGGAFVDRASPRSVMFRASVGRTILTAAIAVLVFARLFQPWELVPAAIALGLVGGLFMPARGSALPAVVGKEMLEIGNGVLQVTQQAAGVLGPVLAGAVVAWRGSGAAFAFDAAAYGLAVLLVGLMRSAAAAPAAAAAGRSGPVSAAGRLAAATRRVGADVVEGLRSVWDDVPLRAVIIVLAVINFCASGPLDVGLPVLARFVWGGAQSLGLVFASFGIGAAAGALVVGSLKRKPPVGWTIVGISIWLGLGLAGFGVLGLWPAVADGVVTGLAIGFANVVGISWIQRRTPDGLLGRVMALITVASMGLTPFAMALSAPLVAYSPALLFGVAGGLLVLTGLACAASSSLRST